MITAMMTKDDRQFIKKEFKGLDSKIDKLDMKIESEIEKLAQMTQAEFAVINKKIDNLSRVTTTHSYDIDRLKIKAGLD